MEFKHLQAFAAVIKYNSFTKAADHLYLTQPTISAQIRQLEEELQTPLLCRTTKSIRVTQAGQELYEYASGILAIRDRIYQRCSNAGEKVIQIGASTIPSAYLLPEALAAYREQCPEIRYELHQSDSRNIIDGLLDGLYDVGFVGMQCQENALSCVPLCQDQMVLITPATEKFLRLREEAVDPIRTLLREPVILREQGSGSGHSAEHFLAQTGTDEQELDVVARVDDSETIKRMVACGTGVAIISDLAVQDEINGGQLLAFYPKGAPCLREFYLTVRKDYPLPDYVQAFIHHLREYYNTETE